MEEVCNYFKKNSFSNKEISIKKKKIYDISIKNNLLENLENEIITKDNIKDLFILYDHIFLFDQFYEYLNKNNIKINFNLDTNKNHDNLGRTEMESEKNHSITMYIGNIKKLVINEYIKIGGIKCYNKLQCLMSVFEHELIHLLIHIFCIDIDYKNNHYIHHGDAFQSILKNIFGHTQVYYLDLKKINKTQKEVDIKINQIKSKIKINDFVESYNIDNKIKSGNIIKIEKDYVIIKNNQGIINNLYYEYINKF